MLSVTCSEVSNGISSVATRGEDALAELVKESSKVGGRAWGRRVAAESSDLVAVVDIKMPHGRCLLSTPAAHNPSP